MYRGKSNCLHVERGFEFGYGTRTLEKVILPPGLYQSPYIKESSFSPVALVVKLAESSLLFGNDYIGKERNAVLGYGTNAHTFIRL